MTKAHIFIVIAISTLSISCSKSSSSGSDSNNDAQGESCILTGTWSRCANYGGNSSGRVHIVASGNQIHEVIEEFNSSPDCQGTADQSMEFHADYILGKIGSSTFIDGGTDADITPDVDLFGCGVGNPAYTVLKFSKDCGQFNTTQTAPSCDPSQRGTSIDPQPFIKQ